MLQALCKSDTKIRGDSALGAAVTVKHIRDYRISPLLHPNPADGKRHSPREAALEEYKLIESAHHPESLPKEVLSKLDQVLTSAEKEMANEV